MKTILVCLATLTACAGGTSSMKASDAKADLVLFNGTVYTMNPLKPRAEGVAVREGLVVAVGTAAEVSKLIGGSTVVVDLQGRALTPGLVDGHCHLASLGHWSEMIPLRGVKSAAAVADLVKAEVAKGGTGWIQGRGWDQNLWSPPEFPGRGLLDAASPDRPVLLRRIDGHALWANGAALRVAGVTRRGSRRACSSTTPWI